MRDCKHEHIITTTDNQCLCLDCGKVKDNGK